MGQGSSRENVLHPGCGGLIPAEGRIVTHGLELLRLDSRVRVQDSDEYA